MNIDPANVDLTNVEDVTDIVPDPHVVVSDTEHHFHGLEHEGKRLLLELLEAALDDEPFSHAWASAIVVPSGESTISSGYTAAAKSSSRP